MSDPVTSQLALDVRWHHEMAKAWASPDMRAAFEAESRFSPLATSGTLERDAQTLLGDEKLYHSTFLCWATLRLDLRDGAPIEVDAALISHGRWWDAGTSYRPADDVLSEAERVSTVVLKMVASIDGGRQIMRHVLAKVIRTLIGAVAPRNGVEGGATDPVIGTGASFTGEFGTSVRRALEIPEGEADRFLELLHVDMTTALASGQTIEGAWGSVDLRPDGAMAVVPVAPILEPDEGAGASMNA